MPKTTTTPDPEVTAKTQRRRFTAEQKRRILTEADKCKKPGELGALLRHASPRRSRCREANS